MPFPDLRRPGVALVPVEALRAFAQAAHQVAVGEFLGRIAGHDLGLVEDAERDRIEAQLSAISSIATSSAMWPGASPGARIALPSGMSSVAM